MLPVDRAAMSVEKARAGQAIEPAGEPGQRNPVASTKPDPALERAVGRWYAATAAKDGKPWLSRLVKPIAFLHERSIGGNTHPA